MVDHKAIREAVRLEKGDWYDRQTWLRQLLDENQRFENRMLKNHRQALANAVVIDELRDANEAQAKEIERYREALEEIKDEEWRLAGEFTTIYTAAYHALYNGERARTTLQHIESGESK